MRTPSLASFFVLGVGLLSLTACGTDKDKTETATPVNAVIGAVSGIFSKTEKSPVEGMGMTRAALANFVTPVDMVTIEKTKAQGVIAKIGENRGVETWSSVDHKTLSMRNGMLVATHGLGEDLVLATVPQISQLTRQGQAYERQHILLDGEDKPVKLRFACKTAHKGTETITVVERAYTTQHLTETCSGPTGGFANDYWLENGGQLRRSRQWISENVGFVVIERLR